MRNSSTHVREPAVHQRCLVSPGSLVSAVVSGILLAHTAQAVTPAAPRSTEALLAQSNPASNPETSSTSIGPAQPATKAAAGSATTGPQEQLEEVVVTGTLIHGVQPTGAELVTIDRSAIEATGASSTTALMAKLPQFASFNSYQTGTTDFANPVPQYALRRSGTNLLLLDGHRLVGAGILQTTPDPSAIPVIALQQVQILPDGASAIYGADAVNGVVNLITRENFDGAETRASADYAHHYHSYDLSQMLGKTWRTGNILAAYEYTWNTPLAFDQLSYYHDNLVPYGGKNHYVNTCANPNVVVGGVSYAAPGFAPGTNMCDPHGASDLIPYTHRASWFVSGHQDITNRVELKGQAYYSSYGATSHVAATSSTFTMTDANPFFVAPPGTGATSETVNYNFSNLFGPTQPSQVNLTSLGVDLELRAELGDEWTAILNGTYGRGTNYARTPAADAAALSAAGVASSPLTAFDPFGNQTSPAVLSAIRGGGDQYTADQGMHDITFTSDGPILTLPGGKVRVAVGADYLWESLVGVPYSVTDGLASVIPKGTQGSSRHDVAEFLQLNVPIVGSGNSMAFVKRLTLSVAGRHDDYSDFGTTSNPEVALTYSPIEAVTLLGSVSTSFQAPSLADMRSVDLRLQTQPNAPFTPTGFQNVPEIFLAGGTPTLQPQTSHNYTIGLKIAPPETGLSLNGTFWHEQIDQQIGLAFPFLVPTFTSPAFSTFWWGPGGQPLTQGVLNNFLQNFRVDDALAALTPAYEQQLIANGYIIDLRRKNLGSTTMDGVDLNADYYWEDSLGSWHAGVAASKELERWNVPGPGVGANDDTPQDPFTGQATFQWQNHLWSGGVNVNYTGPYLATSTDVGKYYVGHFTTVDVSASYRMAPDVLFFRNMSATLKVFNLFDANPPFILTGDGFGAGAVGVSANPLGREFQLTLDWRWD